MTNKSWYLLATKKRWSDKEELVEQQKGLHSRVQVYIYIYIQKGPKKNRVRLDRQVGKKNSFHCGSQKHLAGFHPQI